jgi:hypothetical protein
MFGDPSDPPGIAALKRRAELAEEALPRFKKFWDAVLVAFRPLGPASGSIGRNQL